MAKSIGEQEGWDNIEASESFQEQIGKPAPDLSGDMGAMPEADEATDRLAMPGESLATDDEALSFREQLPTTSDDAAESEDAAAFDEATREQIDEDFE